MLKTNARNRYYLAVLRTHTSFICVLPCCMLTVNCGYAFWIGEKTFLCLVFHFHWKYGKQHSKSPTIHKNNYYIFCNRCRNFSACTMLSPKLSSIRRLCSTSRFLRNEGFLVWVREHKLWHCRFQKYVIVFVMMESVNNVSSWAIESKDEDDDEDFVFEWIFERIYRNK